MPYNSKEKYPYVRVDTLESLPVIDMDLRFRIEKTHNNTKFGKK